MPDENTLFTPEEEQAVQHFQDTFSRDDDGRYRVSLPRRSLTLTLGRSRDIALRRYLSKKET